jgi:prevent-host-death family protein
MQIGLREANQKFSGLIRAVRRGKEVILTDRGKPIAKIVPIKAESREDAIRRMEESGLLIAATKRGPMPPFKPLRIRGKPLSQTVIEDREDR